MWTRYSLWNAWSKARGIPLPAERTTPPGRWILLYDGQCKFCRASVTRLETVAKPDTIVPVDFQHPGILDSYPGITYEACMAALQLIHSDGRVFTGPEAVFRAIGTRPLLGPLTYVYYLPGLRFVFDIGYALVARYRYHLLGKAVAAGECAGGTCALHLKPSARKATETSN